MFENSVLSATMEIDLWQDRGVPVNKHKVFHVEHCTYNHGQPGQRKSWTTRTCSQKERGR